MTWVIHENHVDTKLVEGLKLPNKPVHGSSKDLIFNYKEGVINMAV